MKITISTETKNLEIEALNEMHAWEKYWIGIGIFQSHSQFSAKSQILPSPEIFFMVYAFWRADTEVGLSEGDVYQRFGGAIDWKVSPELQQFFEDDARYAHLFDNPVNKTLPYFCELVDVKFYLASAA